MNSLLELIKEHEIDFEVIRLKHNDEDAQPPNFSFIHINGRSSLLKVCVKYHSTILYWDMLDMLMKLEVL